ncbi:MAG: beta-L-arabinofuranosidase domain-containing protein [Candidatus Izemoplasmatales bacterium]|jgi:DUF1680 family protein
MKAQAVHLFDYGDVTIEKGQFKAIFERDYQYYLSIKVEDMLYELRQHLGLDTQGGKTIADEKGSWFGLGGNVLGQWLQAYSRLYAATASKAAKDKADQLARGLMEVGEKSPILVDGTFMYFFEKYLRGFTDHYLFCNNDASLEFASTFLDHIMASDIYIHANKALGDNGPSSEIEWYTIPESILHFAEIYEKNGRYPEKVEKYREFAEKFAYRRYWDIFVKHDSIFRHTPEAGQNTLYFHAYSHLNTFNSAAAFYRLQNDKSLLKSIKEFYRWMRLNQEIASGGYGCHLEWFMPRELMVSALREYHDSTETQCNSYAVYRLSNFLMETLGDAQYGHWPEKLFYNATLSSIPLENGHVMYYSDFCVKGGEKFLHQNTWTCCTGTRPLLLPELKRMIFYYDEESLFVNLFTPASVTYQGLTLTQSTQFPESSIVSFYFSGTPTSLRLKIRKPEWMKDLPSFEQSGHFLPATLDQKGWIDLGIISGSSDPINMTITPSLNTTSIETAGDPDNGVWALMAGPVMLAMANPDDAPGIPYPTDLKTDFHPGSKPMEFIYRDWDNHPFKPFYVYPKGEHYRVYFNKKSGGR